PLPGGVVADGNRFHWQAEIIHVPHHFHQLPDVRGLEDRWCDALCVGALSHLIIEEHGADKKLLGCVRCAAHDATSSGKLSEAKSPWYSRAAASYALAASTGSLK